MNYMAIPGIALTFNNSENEKIYYSRIEHDTMKAIRILLCDRYNISERDFLSQKKKDRIISDVRQIYMAIAKTLITKNNNIILWYANRKNHASIFHAKHLCEEGMPLHKEYQKTLQVIKKTTELCTKTRLF